MYLVPRPCCTSVLFKAKAPGCGWRQTESVFHEVFVCSLYYNVSKQNINRYAVCVLRFSSPHLLITNMQHEAFVCSDMNVELRHYIVYILYIIFSTATGMRFSALIIRSVQKLAGTTS
jgi:hypothetical protein